MGSAAKDGEGGSAVMEVGRAIAVLGILEIGMGSAAEDGEGGGSSDVIETMERWGSDGDDGE